MGSSLEIPDCDFETRSEAGYFWNETTRKYTSLPPVANGKKKGLKLVGAAVYAMHPSTDVLSFCFDLKDQTGPELWLPGMPNPERIFEHVAAGGLLEAWFSGFEYWIWTHVCIRRYGWPAINPRQFRCAMAKSRAYAMPGKLEEAGAVLGVDVQKDKEGKRLLDKFSIPRTPTRKDPRHWITCAEDPVDAAKLYAYNGTDIAAEAAVSAVVPDLEGINLEFWQLDQAINRRGVAIDEPSLRAAIAIVQQAHLRYNAELFTLTGGTVAKASELARLAEWLRGKGVHSDGLTEESIDELLTRNLPADCRRALEIRQAIGSASVKKLFAMSDQLAPDGRLHDLFMYHGAHTGRPTGSGPQPTNLPKAGPNVYKCTACSKYFGASLLMCGWCGAMRGPSKALEWSPEAAVDALEVIATRSLDLLEMTFGDAMLAIAGCLRGLFVSAPGFDLISSDYSAIEAVVLAELAGEEWRREVFNTHGLIYEMSGARVMRVPFEDVIAAGKGHPARAKGKINELALGYGGWVGALLAFGAKGTEEELARDAAAWREASPMVVELWGGQRRKNPITGVWGNELFGVEGAFIAAMQNPGQTFRPVLSSPTAAGKGLEFIKPLHCDAVFIRLLSGRRLTYHRPRLDPSERRRGTLDISYEGWNTNPKNGATGWIRKSVYGPKFVENIDQATAHDLQRVGLLAQEAAGYWIVLHVYDENVAEVREGWGSVEEFESLMNVMPDWANGWPVKAVNGFREKRYRKDDGTVKLAPLLTAPST